MSDRGQHTPPPASPEQPEPAPAPGSSADQPTPPTSEPSAPPPPAPDDTPLELSATPDDPDSDNAFGLTAAESDDTTRPAKPRSRTRTIVLASLLAVTVAGAGAMAVFGWRINSQRNTTLATPTSIGSLTLDDSEEATATADYLQTALSAEIPMTKAVGAVYTGADEKSVLFFGGTSLFWSPGSELDTAFDLVGDDQGAVTEISDVEAGDLGGTMKCGVTHSPEGDLTVCGWADHGSLALAMFPNRTPAEAAPLMLQIRSATQTRS
ncbi:hypothetical protein FHR83_007810 [Actinoplanes campanulatus]|uniref:Uncharacterized protein n=1 Tax=Actinoplanes campanulatus TaxID=113559 RepID=A0A7W5FJ36_9ACTN|nr:hypothetical protein [Actinoplanes campanulatus]MBB3100090.1 hypothetical protein [Actinoplanes campanulatus]GGN28142.1 hypothetical protein GCM10010109_46240 [Actinoplanes campanulatus]GID39098.1 hypothetical protein Aca09nite_56040 [Actinoplanes campanulatus]